LGTANVFHYYAFGLNLSSEIELPELIIGSVSEPDFTIQFGELPERLETIAIEGVRYQATVGKFLLTMDNIATYLVEEGKKITISPIAGAREEDIRLFLLGSAFGALLHQRNYLVMHGSAVTLGSQAFIFSGLSGTGKSTLAASLVQHGFRLLSDDVCAIRFTNENHAVLYPAYPQMKLWNDALSRLGEDPQNHRRVRQDLEKYGIRADEAFVKEPVQLKQLFILTTKNSEGHQHSEIKGIEKFTAIRNNTYRFQFIEGLGLTKSHFQLTGKLAARTGIFRLVRSQSPQTKEPFEEFVRRIINC
jgi:hypothetical protein